jgi:protein-disulfide isomerase
MASSEKSPINQNNLLVGALIIFAFFAGYLYFKVQSLEKGATGTTAQTTPANQPPAEPTPNLEAMPAVNDKDHIRGNKKANITLVEYSDYECPYCGQFHPTMQQVMKEYGDKVRWVYRHYPLSFHPKAMPGAQAGECVAELAGNDAFWKFSDLMFEKIATTEVAGFADLAASIGVNKAAFQKCVDSGKHADKIRDMQSGGAKAGINGTPGTIIVAKNGNKQLIPGALPFDQIKPMIDGILK